MFPLVPDPKGRAEEDTQLQEELRQFVYEGLTAHAEQQRIREKLEIAGYSPKLSRRIVSEVVASFKPPGAGRWASSFRNIAIGILLIVASTTISFFFQPGCFTFVLGLAGLCGLVMIGLGVAASGKKG